MLFEIRNTIIPMVRDMRQAMREIGPETGQLSNWADAQSTSRGVPVVCMDARHAKVALSLQINKTDLNHAFGGEVVRTGWYRRSR